MSTILQESTFLTVNLQKILNKKGTTDDTKVVPDAKPQPQKAGEAKGTATPASGDKQATKGTNDIAWGEELKRRLDENKKADKQAQRKPSEIRVEFFKEYFNAVWGEELAKELLELGLPLMEDIETLGFDKKKNPILSFLQLQHVKENILAPGLLTGDHYDILKAVITSKTIPDSEFKKANDYNIIYCADLYRKPSDEVEAYVKLQAQHLRKGTTAYSEDMQRANRVIFLQLSKNTATGTTEAAKKQLAIAKELIRLPSMLGKGSHEAKLNSIELVRAILAESDYGRIATAGPHTKSAEEGSEDKGRSADGTSAQGGQGQGQHNGPVQNGINGQNVQGSGHSEEQTSVGSEKLKSLIDRAETLEEKYALLQYIYMNTVNQSAYALMKDHKQLKNLTQAAITDGTRKIASDTKGVKLTRDDADMIVTALKGILDSMKTKRVRTPADKPADKPAETAPTQKPAKTAQNTKKANDDAAEAQAPALAAV